MLKSKNDVFPPRSIAPGNSPLQGRKSPIRPQDARRKIESRKLPQNVFSAANLPGRKSLLTTSTSLTLDLPTFAGLAEMLDNDVDKIYDFVRRIKFLCTFGSQKGALAAVLSGHANSFDQADLMHQILLAAGYDAKLVYGTLKMNGAQAGAWLGTDPTNVWAARNMLANGGIPTDAYWDPAVSDYFVEAAQCWVKVDIGGTWYHFDPAYKTHTAIAGEDLQTILGYDQTTFETAALAGATVTADYYQDLNTAGVAAQMSGFEANLIDWIDNNNPAATFDDLIGYKTIDDEVGPIRNTQHPLLKSGTTPTDWTAIPNAYKTTLRVQYDTIDETFYSSDIANSRLTLFFNTSIEGELRLDGTLLATSTAQGAGTWNSVLLTIEHPYADPWANQSFYQRVWAGQSHLIGQSWGNSSPEMAYMHQRLLQRNLEAGVLPADEEALGESLAVLWHTWNAEKTITSDIASRLGNCGFVLHHQVGLVGHGEAPFMDLGGIVWSTSANDNDYSKVAGIDYVISMRGVGFEGGSISQVPGVEGVCTNTVMSRANAAGQKLYFADSTNWSTNVRPNLVNYSTQMLDDIENWYINWHWKVLIHEDGATTQGDYEGYGFYAISPYGGCVGIINGYLLGGGGAYAQSADENAQNAAVNQQSIFVKDSLNRIEVGEQNEPQFDWMVDMFSGSAKYRHLDFNPGTRPFPFSLPFVRFYGSENGGVISNMGKGWRHNYMIDLSEQTQAMAGLGAANTPARAGAANLADILVAIMQVSGYYNGKPFFIFNMVKTEEANKKLTGNVVTVRDGENTYNFSALSDGTYMPAKSQRFGLALVATDPLLPYFQMQSFDGTIYKFNPGRKIEKITFKNGITVNFTYAAASDNHLTRVETSLDEHLDFEYEDVSGLLFYIKKVTSSRAGVIGNYTINTGNGVLEKWSDRTNFESVYTYDTQDRLTQYTRPNAAAYKLTYNDDGRVLRLEGPGTIREFSYLLKYSEAWTQTTVSGAGGTVQTIYNVDGTPRHVIEGGLQRNTQYDGFGRVTQTTEPYGEVTNFIYDSWGRVSTKIRGEITEHYLFNDILSDSWDKWTSYTNPRGKVFQRVYEPNGALISETGPNGTKVWLNNVLGLPVTYTDENGMVTGYTYDSYGQLLTTTIDDGGLELKTTLTRNAVGDVISSEDPKGNVITTSYNNMRFPTGMTAPLGSESKYTVDSVGNRTKTENKASATPTWQETNTTFSKRNLITKITDPLGHETATEYNYLDLPIKVTDAEGRETQYFWTPFKQLEKIIDANLVVEEERTYSGGLVASIKDSRGNISTMLRDTHGRLTKLTYPDSSYEQWDYDKNSNVTSFRSRAGIITTLAFDDTDRLISKTVGLEPTQTFTFDDVGRLLTASTPVVAGDPSSGTFSKAYDTAGRLISDTNPQGQVVGYELDDNGNITKITYPGGYYVQYAYDALNRVTSIKLNGSATDAVSFTYDLLSRRTTKTYANGNSVTYGFDIANRLTSRSLTHAGGTATWGYGHNDVNQITSQTISDAAFEWTPAATSSVSYGTPNNLNQYPTVGGATQSHTTDGQLLSDAVWTYQYDGEGMLIAANKTGVAASFKYDPFSRLIERTVNTNKTRYVYAGSRLLEEYDSATSTLLKRYVYAGDDEALIEIDGAGNVTYLHQDHQNSLIARANGAGTLTAKYKYSPWGEASLPGTGFGYTGQRWDADLGLYNYKARYYDPVKGRFLQPDPVGYLQDMNLYTYCVNDPVNMSDPTGMLPSNAELENIVKHLAKILDKPTGDNKGNHWEWHSLKFQNGKFAEWYAAPVAPSKTQDAMSTPPELALEVLRNANTGTAYKMHVHPTLLDDSGKQTKQGEVISATDVTTSNDTGIDSYVLTPSHRLLYHEAQRSGPNSLHAGDVTPTMMEGVELGSFSRNGAIFVKSDGSVIKLN